MWPMQINGDDAMLYAIEGKMANITQDVTTLGMEWIPMDMYDHVVGIPPPWLRLIRWVIMIVLCYWEDVESAAAKEAEDHP